MVAILHIVEMIYPYDIRPGLTVVVGVSEYCLNIGGVVGAVAVAYVSESKDSAVIESKY